MDHRSKYNVLGLPFDQYQRYKIVQESVDILRENRSGLKILDVGGYPGQALGFFPNDEVTILDQEESDLPQYKKGDALSLPFPDKSFNVVISADALEHIPPDNRQLFMKELCRVSREYVCIAAPFDHPQVHEAELILFEFIKAKLGYEHHFLHDHLSYGLPNLQDTVNYLRDSLGDIAILPNGNLSRWLPMMIAEFYFDVDAKLQVFKDLLNEYYNKYYYRIDNSEPCYRYLIVAGQEHMIHKFRPALESLKCSKGDSNPLNFSVVSLLIEFINLELLQKANHELRQKDGELRQKDGELRQKDGELRQKEEQIRQLEASLEKVRNTLAYKIYSKTIKPLKRLLKKMDKI